VARVPVADAELLIRFPCTDCGGHGKDPEDKRRNCKTCNGSGKLLADVTLPEFSRLLGFAAAAGGEVESELEARPASK
jgi:DnaJ-class molecular chaperone